MQRRALRIRDRIALPFSLLFIAALLTAALVSISIASRALDERVTAQIGHVSEMISQTDFALNPAIVSKLELIVGAEIVSYRRGGSVLVHTLDEAAEGDADLLRVLVSSDAEAEIFERGKAFVLRDVVHRGVPYKVAYRALRSPADAVLALATPTSEIAQAKRSIARSIALLAALIVALMGVLSVFVARNITRPMTRLVAFTRRVAAGDLEAKAAVETRDEVGALVEAFNDMVARLRESERELVRSEKLALTGQLAARVAHDVRNPLSSMKMQAQLLRSKLEADPSGRASLEAILREIDRVEWVVKGLLDLARPGELRLEKGDPNAVVEDALRSSEARLRHLKIRIERRLAPELPALRVDAAQLGAGILNLIQNAAEAMPDGGTLRVSTALASDGSTVSIALEDEGSGVPPEHRGRLFDPFFTTKREGVGLGLLNTKSIVERHGGSLELFPALPRGTRVVISLPSADG